MPKAKVSISCITTFLSAIGEEQSSAVSLMSRLSCIDKIVQDARKELDKIQQCERRCDSAMASGTAKLNELNNQLSSLQSALAATPPTVTEYVYRGTDSEGDPIYDEVEVPNPEYHRLLAEIAEVQGRISNLQSLLSQLGQTMQSLASARQTISNAITVLMDGQSQIAEACKNIIKKSDLASTQLKKAISIINKYLSETTHTNPVPSHTSIPWNNSTSITPSAPDSDTVSDHGLWFKPRWSKGTPSNNTMFDLQATNPNYDLGEEWQINCQRCVPTFELRARGYNVTANPRTNQDDHLSYYPFDVWKNPTVEQTYGTGRDEIEQAMAQWGEGARAQVVVVWGGTNSGHTFIAEQRNGQTVFIDPQTNEADVSYYFDDVRSGYTQFCRIDTLEPSKYIKQCCKEIK